MAIVECRLRNLNVYNKEIWLMTSRENLFDQYWVWIETPGTPLPPKRDAFLRLRRNGKVFASFPIFGRNRRNGR